MNGAEIVVVFSVALTGSYTEQAPNWKLLFLELNQKIWCGYTKHMFELMDKKIIAILRNYFCLTGPMLSANVRILRKYLSLCFQFIDLQCPIYPTFTTPKSSDCLIKEKKLNKEKIWQTYGAGL